MQGLTSLLFLGSALAAPTPFSALEERATQQCGQYQQQSNGGYTLSTNGWGWSSGTGSQCSEINSVSGTTIAVSFRENLSETHALILQQWDTTWSWSGTATQVKSYTNVQSGFTQKQLSLYKSIPTTWKWSYTGTNLAANVAYDTFVGSSASGANLFEVSARLKDMKAQ
ncbi:hypothetical protein LTR17_026371 [Elasticomyces elasticus]|nr:hypothetical protein LTR17_026371 [Elasticomyces elasticus]